MIELLKMECSLTGGVKATMQRAVAFEGTKERRGVLEGFEGGRLVLECMAAGSEGFTNLFDSLLILHVIAFCLETVHDCR